MRVNCQPPGPGWPRGGLGDSGACRFRNQARSYARPGTEAVNTVRGQIGPGLGRSPRPLDDQPIDPTVLAQSQEERGLRGGQVTAPGDEVANEDSIREFRADVCADRRL